jgi:HYR domain-containing protein
MMRITNRVAVLTLGAGVAAAALAAASGAGGGGTLNLNNVFLKGQAPKGVTCPAGTPSGAVCWAIDSSGLVRGLGMVTESGVLVVQNHPSLCEDWQATPVLTVAGKGTFQLSVHNPSCISDPNGGGASGSLSYVVTGGTGDYGGASGSGTDVENNGGLMFNNTSDTLTGTLTAPNTTFDLTPPTIAVKAKKTVRAPRGAKRVRVRYTARAQDAVDGSVPVKCKPRSGSRFKVGRTRVTCTATDSSANTATKKFTVTVKRR